MPVQPIETPSLPAPSAPYSPVVRAGDWLVIAGQIGFDYASRTLVEGLDAQARLAFAHLRAILGDCGAELSDVARATVYLADMADYARMNELFAEGFDGHRPARTTLQVAGLPGGARVEIEAWAYRPQSQS